MARERKAQEAAPPEAQPQAVAEQALQLTLTDALQRLETATAIYRDALETVTRIKAETDAAVAAALRKAGVVSPIAAAPKAGRTRIAPAVPRKPREGQGPTTRDVLLATLAGGPATSEDITAAVAATGKDPVAASNAVRSLLSTMTREGALVKLEKAPGEKQRYALANPVISAVAAAAGAAAAA